EVEEALNVLRVRLGLRLSGLHLRPGRQDVADLGRELSRARTGSRLGTDLVELPDALEQSLRGSQVEARKRCPAEVRRPAEMAEAGDLHPQRRPVRLHADRLSDLEVILARGRLVDHDLIRSRPAPVDERKRVELGLVRIDAEAEIRRTAEVDDLAVD